MIDWIALAAGIASLSGFIVLAIDRWGWINLSDKVWWAIFFGTGAGMAILVLRSIEIGSDKAFREMDHSPDWEKPRLEWKDDDLSRLEEEIHAETNDSIEDSDRPDRVRDLLDWLVRWREGRGGV